MSTELIATRRLQRYRDRRDLMLARSDWTQLTDAPLSAAGKAEWAAYRQLLRDLPEEADSDGRFVWPARPDTNLHAN